MIFPRIICSLPLIKVARIELSLANLHLFTPVPAFSIFSSFSSQETVNVLLLVFSEINYPLISKIPSKTSENYKKNIAFRERPVVTAL